MPIFELLLFALGGSIRQATGEETVSHLIELHAFAFSSLGAVMFSLLFESVFGMVSTKKPIIAPPPSDVDTAPSEMDTVKVK
ncbi:hypothetical protein EDD86DRAFT_210010 [Gorgonomyces haynaldii]|nr:hypothetical protein EDD86DRAFT_210010 [Gorgonomyces haynaldii]